MEPAYVYRAVATRIIDGDTFIARVDLGFRVSVEINVRIQGVDTPEDSAGAAATAFLAKTLRPGLGPASLILRSYKGRQSFARWVCEVWTPEGPLADLIVGAGYGVAYTTPTAQ